MDGGVSTARVNLDGSMHNSEARNLVAKSRGCLDEGNRKKFGEDRRCRGATLYTKGLPNKTELNFGKGKDSHRRGAGKVVSASGKDVLLLALGRLTIQRVR